MHQFHKNIYKFIYILTFNRFHPEQEEYHEEEVEKNICENETIEEELRKKSNLFVSFLFSGLSCHQQKMINEEKAEPNTKEEITVE